MKISQPKPSMAARSLWPFLMFSGALTSRVDRLSTMGRPSPEMEGSSSTFSSRPCAEVTSTARPPARAMPVQMPMAASSEVPMTKLMSLVPAATARLTFSPTSEEGVMGKYPSPSKRMSRIAWAAASLPLPRNIFCLAFFRTRMLHSLPSKLCPSWFRGRPRRSAGRPCSSSGRSLPSCLPSRRWRPGRSTR